MEIKDIAWFKNEIAPILKGYDIDYRFYDDGDFGALNQVIFNSAEKGGTIDFWSKDWLGIEVVDYKNDIQVMNILLEPHEYSEKQNAFNELFELLR